MAVIRMFPRGLAGVDRFPKTPPAPSWAEASQSGSERLCGNGKHGRHRHLPPSDTFSADGEETPAESGGINDWPNVPSLADRQLVVHET